MGKASVLLALLSACSLQFSSWHDSLSVWYRAERQSCQKVVTLFRYMVSQKLLDFAKCLVTNFQLKYAERSEILLKIVIFKMIKINLWSYARYQFFVLHSLSVNTG